MLHIVACVTDIHDLRFVAAACCICGLASFATFQTLARAARAGDKARRHWTIASGVVFGGGVWVTHFVAMLGYAPGMSMAFQLPLTGASLLLAIVGGIAGQSLALSASNATAMVGGLLTGATIGSMHFAGMAALHVPGVIEYDPREAVVAWTMGLVFAPLATWRFRRGGIKQAAALLVLAVAGVHFIAMAAVNIVPDGSVVDGVPVGAIAVAVAAVGLIVLLGGLGTVFVDTLLEQWSARENARFRRFADATFEGLFFVEHGVVSDVNSVLCQMLARDEAQIVGASLYSFFAPRCRGALENLSAGGMEVEMLDAAGGSMVVDVLARPLTERDGARVVIAVRDASDRKRAEQRIQELAHVDPLTGLANRLLLRDRLAQALAMADNSAGRVAVLCLDLDRFKIVNDQSGHHAGDSLLVGVANRLRAETRETDTVARLGGDEFLVLQPFGGQPDAAQALAQRLVQVLAEPFEIDATSIHVTASIGIALYPDDASSGDMLLKMADLALYRAKDEGRSCWRFFEPTMDSALRARRAMEQDLREALHLEQFHLHYQPIFDAKGVSLVGYEALLRWTHPTRGAIPPDQFVSLAEECGAIVPIGQWVLEAACTQAASWSEPLTVAVNLSPAQFQNSDFPAVVADILERTGLTPERLELEITEGLLIRDAERALRILSALKAQGVRIALDDFGTGYSSLSYLRRFPFDRLKIDRSFISELGMDADADSIVRSIIAMSRSLRLRVTAEGVETEEQLAILQGLECGSVQGYLLGRPRAEVPSGATATRAMSSNAA